MTETEHLPGSRYEHNCADWDFMLIDERHPEFASCGCFGVNPEVLAIQDRLNLEMDALRSANDHQ